MKVLFTVDALINAGTERSMLDLVPHFSAGTQLIVVYFYPRHDLKAEYEAAGISLRFVNLPGKFSFWKGVSGLKKIIKEEQPDIIISSLLRANLISRVACKMTGTPLIGTFVSDSYSKQRTSSFSFTHKLGFTYYYWLDRLTAQLPVAYISNSESIKQSNCAALKIPASKVKVIYRGRDTQMFHSWVPPIPETPFRFASIGRLFKTKGFTDLFKAFARLEKQFPDIHLDIYGEGPFRKDLTILIQELGLADKIKLHGNIKNAWSKLYDAHCFVFPSWYEGFSGALVESMMVGIPIIASDIPMNLEAVKDRETALVHKMKDIGDIEQKMTNMIKAYESYIYLGKNARDLSIRKFDIQQIAGEYEQFIQEKVLPK